MSASTPGAAAVAGSFRDDEAFRAGYLRLSAALAAGDLGAAELDGWRRERLATVLGHVTRRSPFYRRHLAGHDLDAVTPATLDRLPFTTKADLWEAGYDVLCGPVSEAVVVYETTGTTGPPTPCPRGPRDVFTSNTPLAAAWRRMFRARFGDRPPVVGLMGPSELYAFGDVFTAVTAEIGACHVKIWPDSPRVGFPKALRLIRDLGVDVIVCSPGMCLRLAEAALEHGYEIADLPVSLFLVLGEICTPEFAANVSAVWPGAVVWPGLYGSQESLCLAAGAPSGDLHLSELNYLVEIVEPGGDRVLVPPAGVAGEAEGELVVTMLSDGIKPLVRYRTGDLVRLHPGLQGAGQPPGRRVEVLGRIGDGIPLGGRDRRPAELERLVLGGVRGCLGYQIVIDTGADGRDELVVRLRLLDPGADGARVRDRLTARLREQVGVPVTVTVLDRLDPSTADGAYLSWKTARVLDRRTAPDGAR